MLAIKLAFRNLIGAGLRTWLNVIVLSISYVLIIMMFGMLDGWNIQARTDTIDWEVGNGQLWHQDYDPYDPFTFEDAHLHIAPEINTLVEQNMLTPILLTQATIYPQGRMQSILLKGIDVNQTILKIPVSSFKESGSEIPAVIGQRMAKLTMLKVGDRVLVRWRDKNGTFDAIELIIVEIFKTDVPSVDNGQFWIPLDDLQKMTGMINEATILVARKEFIPDSYEGWVFKDLTFLFTDLDNIIQQKKIGQSVMVGLLLIIALLAIFDTQVLSIFRRQKEIGTYIAMGMTRSQVVGLFTVEGAAHSIFAAIVGAIYGVPLFLYLAKSGIKMPEMTDDMGIAIAQYIFPVYSLSLIAGTIIFIVIAATIVSYIPARKISKMKPTDALRGKLQ